MAGDCEHLGCVVAPWHITIEAFHSDVAALAMHAISLQLSER